MSRDPLRTMLQIRRRTLDEAQAAVGEAYRLEQVASSTSDQAAETLDHEMKTAMNLTGGDDVVETYARWLPVGREALKRAQDAQRDAVAGLDRARAVLALARSGVRAVETLIEDRDRVRQLGLDSREQQALDESGSRRPAR